MTRPVVYGPPAVAILDLPQLREGSPAHQPLAAVHAVPWPGRITAWTSPGEDAFTPATTLGRPARMGRLVSPLYAGPTSRFDLGNVAIVDLAYGALASVTDLALFAGGNALAVESSPGVWEVPQAGVAELIAPGRYRLSRLLRGQRGTEGAISSPAPAGARVVVLDEALVPLPIPEAAMGLEANWRFGPASKPVADRSYRQRAFTPEGVGLRPFSVGQVRQPWRTAREPGDLVIAWTRRSRALAADSWTAAEVPLAEEREAYEVEILDGSSVLRMLTASTPAVTYPPPSSSPTSARCSAPATRSRSPSSSSPPSSGGGRRPPLRSSSIMSDTSTHLLLPYLLAAQAQKHVTVNEALRLLDGLVQLAVLDQHLTAPPASPADGDRYIVASGATGAWSGWDLNVAYWVDGVNRHGIGTQGDRLKRRGIPARDLL